MLNGLHWWKWVRMTLLVSLAGTVAVAGVGPFELVADLEDDRPARPAFGGWAWSAPGGLVVAGGDALWRVDPLGVGPPVLLLRMVDPARVQQLEGELVAWGLSDTGELGLWLTDGGPVRRLAPSSSGVSGSGRGSDGPYRVARRGDVLLAKGVDQPWGSSLWRLSETEEPVWLGPGGVLADVFYASCTNVWTTAVGFVDCGLFDGAWELRFNDGNGPGEQLPFSPNQLDDELPGLLVDGKTYLSANGGGGLLVTDGTPSGTQLLEHKLLGPLFELWDKAAWVACDSQVCRVWAAGPGGPSVVVELPAPMHAAAPSPIDTTMYFHRSVGYYPHYETTLWALDPARFGLVGTLPGRVMGSVLASGAGSEVLVLLQSGRSTFELWRADAATSRVERITTADLTALPRARAVLLPLAEGIPPLVPWIDSESFARPARVAETAEVVPFEGLILAGTASSRAMPLGRAGNTMVFAAFTAAEGGSVWRSDGTAAGTERLFATACNPAGWARPQLKGDLVVDCERSDGRATAWILGEGEPRPFDLEVGVPGPDALRMPPAVVSTPGALVYGGPAAAQWSLLGLDSRTGVTTELGPSGCQVFGATSNRALAFCPDGVWSSDGTAANTVPLPVAMAAHVEAGDRVLLTGAETWLTDGTPQGSQRLASSLAGAAPASAQATFTCAWNNDGLWRLDLTSGALDLLSLTAPMSWSAVTRVGDAVALLHGWDSQGRRSWWRCDGTGPGTRELFADKPIGSAERLIANDEFVWRSTRGVRERVARMSLATGRWVTVLDLDRAVQEFPSQYTEQFEPLGLTDDRLWVMLFDERYGREPWTLPLGSIFVDGFESGDIGAWSPIGAD